MPTAVLEREQSFCRHEQDASWCNGYLQMFVSALRSDFGAIVE